MKNMEQQFSEDLMITQSLKSARDAFLVDLVIEILSRVPAKSIARFRCVSKFWESILAGPYFSELFLTNSVARPRLFFALKVNEELFVFSTPQPQNPDEKYSSLVVTPYNAFPNYFRTETCIPLYGLVFLQNWTRKTCLQTIWNPIMGESVTLPEREDTDFGQSHFGFDPISKQFKVFSTTRWSCFGTHKITARVLTLEPGKLLWRPIQNPLLPSHYVSGYHNEICINGVVYYRANFKTSPSEIVCFNFSSERFGLINMDKDMLHDRHFTLFNYKGRLGVYEHPISLWCKEECVFWVLEDAGKHKWSKRLLVMPFLEDEILMFVGMTSTGELVFSSYYLSNPFYIFYYNIERKTFARFTIKGFEEIKHDEPIIVRTFLDYVESLKFI